MLPNTIEIIRQLCDNANPRHLDGWCWFEKAIAMAELIEVDQPAIVVEHGIFGGRSMLPMALQLRDNGRGVIFGTDPWTKPASLEGQHAKVDSDWWGRIDHSRIMLKFMGRLEELGLIDWAVPMRGSSQAISVAFAEESIDILHIDGNHSQEVSLRDEALWFDKVRPDGYIWLDDIDWPTNAACVRSLDERCNIMKDVKTEGLGHCRLYQKRVT